MPAGIRGAQDRSSLPRYIWVNGPHAKAADGMNMNPANNKTKNIIMKNEKCSPFLGLDASAENAIKINHRIK